MNWKGLNNNWITKGLFIEYRYLPKVGDHYMYTLQHEDRDSYPSLRRLYLESDDPTEYTFACEHLGGWDHWKYLCDEEFFKPTVALWRDEYSIRMKALALRKIKLEAKGEGKLSYDANKYLLEEGWTKEKLLKERERLVKDKERWLAQKEKEFSKQLQASAKGTKKFYHPDGKPYTQSDYSNSVITLGIVIVILILGLLVCVLQH